MQQVAKGQGELERFEVAIEQHNAEIERVTAETADAEAAVARVERELSEVGGQPMREQREQVEVLKKVPLLLHSLLVAYSLGSHRIMRIGRIQDDV